VIKQPSCERTGLNRPLTGLGSPFFSVLILAALALAGCNGGGSGDNRGDDSSSSPSGKNFDDGTMEMVLIPAGSFNMGSRTGSENERPVHKVWVDAFLMDSTEVTNASFDKVGKDIAEPNPSHFKGLSRPVEQIKVEHVIRYCIQRSKMEGLEPCYNLDNLECDFSKNGYRLPTEAEWEYACRAGTETDYSFGDEQADLSEYAWYSVNSPKSTQPVARKKPNAFGLYDMHGNVAEWCQDMYAKDYYKTSPEKNPRGPTPPPDGADLHVLRGGSWKTSAPMCRSAYRAGENPGYSDACLAKDAIGFRCVRKAP
jgi:formylglycine-generating enzyme required for sulfatase activity